MEASYTLSFAQIRTVVHNKINYLGLLTLWAITSPPKIENKRTEIHQALLSCRVFHWRKCLLKTNIAELNFSLECEWRSIKQKLKTVKWWNTQVTISQKAKKIWKIIYFFLGHNGTNNIWIIYVWFTLNPRFSTILYPLWFHTYTINCKSTLA